MAMCVLMNPLASAPGDPADRELDDGRQWLEAEAGLAKDLPPLQRAAAAAALNDTATAGPLLRSVIRAQPGSDAASQAHELLSRIYLRSGQYRRLIQNLDDWTRAFPGRAAVLEEQSDVGLFRGLPDQINGRRRASRLVHEAGDDFSIPLSINGQPATYLLDTGAWVSVMTEAEAARLHLITSSGGRIGDASGTGVPVRTAVVSELTIGSMQFKDVSFAIVPGEEPGGIIGMPIQLALGRLQWSSDGNWELGGRSTSSTSERPNLVFYENKLLLSMEVLGRREFGALDTGAGTTDLNNNFATEFAEFVRINGTKQTNPITGLGGTATFEGVILPEVHFVIDGTDAVLSPAHVTLQALPSMGGECCVGNIGRDLLTRTRRVTLDFSSMTLRLD